jgi:signal peptidase II
VAGDLLLFAVLTFLLDQASKRIVLRRFQARPRGAPGRGPRIRAVLHAGLGVGLVRDIHNRRALLALWALAAIGTLLLLEAHPFRSHVAAAGFGAAVGGATSNLADILRRGAVVDFIDLRLWPVFNLADAAIAGGVAIALWSVP